MQEVRFYENTQDQTKLIIRAAARQEGVSHVVAGSGE